MTLPLHPLIVLAGLLVAAPGRAEELEVNIAYVPTAQAEALSVEQPIGRLVVRAWDRAEVKIVARKRAPSSAALDRLKVNVELVDGRVRIRSGVRMAEGFRAVPAPRDSAMGIDLTIDAPRGMQVSASTWAGDLDVSGFRAGADLSSKSGAVRVSDISGTVKTHALAGAQRLSAIRGDVEADGISGDLELVSIDGQVLVAKVEHGQITAREIRSPVVRLWATSGGVVLVGSLRLGGRYDLGANEGDVRVELGAKGPLTLHASAPKGQVRLTGVAPAATLALDLDGGGPLLDLRADHGNIQIDRPKL